MIDTLLTTRKANFDANGGYKQDSMPEVYTYYKKWIDSGKYPYLSQIVDYITQNETISVDNLSYLKTEVYLASQQHKREQDKIYCETMIKEGWRYLTSEAVKKEYDNHNKIMVKTTIQGAIFTSAIENTFKPFIDSEGHAWIMKPRATRKGYSILNLEMPFYKVV